LPSSEEWEDVETYGLEVFGTLSEISQDPNLDWALIILGDRHGPPDFLGSDREYSEYESIDQRKSIKRAGSSRYGEVWDMTLKQKAGKPHSSTFSTGI
jgi:hypothetical protein